jgi:SAM-dependent methyltransferase
MADLSNDKRSSMKSYFDSVLDPFNIRPAERVPRDITVEHAVLWYGDSSVRYAHKCMGDLKGKAVLDVGCGTGAHLIWLARQGAKVTGIDISDKRVDAVKELIKSQSLEDRVSVFVRSGEATDFPDGSFDIVCGQDVLMFLGGDFAPFIAEARRILKTGGSLVFSEALDRHPVARLYRKYAAPREWKDFTHYFSTKYMDQFARSFEIVRYKTFYLTGFVIYFFKMYMPIYSLFYVFDVISGAIDTTLTAVFPGLKKYCWRIVFQARKAA